MVPGVYKRPETAILEVPMHVPGKVSFEHADQLMEGLTTLSPKRLSATLKRCKNVKVLRLLFWLAERHQHPWYKKLSPRLSCAITAYKSK